MPNMDHTGPVGRGQKPGLGEGQRHGQGGQGKGRGHGSCHRWGQQKPHSDAPAIEPPKTEEA